MFKKIRLYTHENIGTGPVNLPELNMHTTAYWVSFSKELTSSMSETDIKNALIGFSNVLANSAPVFLMCDPRDIRVVYQVRSSFTQKPTIYIYDSCPGGVGFGSKLFELHNELFSLAERMIDQCGCESGCPSCVGPLNEFTGEGSPKTLTQNLLKRMGSNV
jgi:DEAD/DEAH box helicase domain-containing protein